MKHHLDKQTAFELQKYAREINELELDIQHCDTKSRSTFSDSIARRIEQGQKLLQAKALCPKGEWELWCSTLTISKSTIERRMNDARNPSRLTGARVHNEVLALAPGAQPNGEQAKTPAELLPSMDAIGKTRKLHGYFERHKGELHNWPVEHREALWSELKPVAVSLIQSLGESAKEEIRRELWPEIQLDLT
jgi:hypothetical protein